MERFLFFGGAMNKNYQTSRELVQEVLDTYQIKMVELAKMLEVNPSMLSRFCSGHGSLNNRAMCLLLEFWHQGKLLPPVAPSAIDREAETQAMIDQAAESLATAKMHLKKHLERLAKMLEERVAQQIKVQRLKHLDLSKPIFEEHQQRHWALFEAQNEGKGISQEKIAELEIKILMNQAEIGTLERIVRGHVKKT